MAFNPKVLLPLSHIGEQDEFRVQDASSFCALDERLSYWELLVRHPGPAIQENQRTHGAEHMNSAVHQYGLRL